MTDQKPLATDGARITLRLKGKRLLLPECGSLDAIFIPSLQTNSADTGLEEDSVIRNLRITAATEGTLIATGTT